MLNLILVTSSYSKWTIEETEISLNNSDIVYYWYYLAFDGQGYEITDQMWSPGGPIITTTEGIVTKKMLIPSI